MADSLREHIINRIKHFGRFDWSFERGDCNAKDFKDYESWLRSLNDDDLADAFARLQECRSE